MPYRIDLRASGDDTLDRLIELGAIDAEASPDGGLAALMPDSVAPDLVARALGLHDISVTPAVGRDAESVWVLSQRPVSSGRFWIVPAHMEAAPGDLRLVDSDAFGTGMHPTTALCLEALEKAVQVASPEAVLDVGTGSGVLALAALMMGVPHAVGIDIDDDALRTAAENARLNGLDERLQLTRGGPGSVTGTWPLVLANVLAAPLIEMAPTLVRRVGHRGQLILSGIPSAVEEDVYDVYRRLGMQHVRSTSRGAWAALVLRASW